MINNVTRYSLRRSDELGSGTNYREGVSISYAILKYINIFI